MTRLYSNENFPLPVVERLRALGHDVLTTEESGKADQAVPDEEILKFAIGANRVLLTLTAAISFVCIGRTRSTPESLSALLTLILAGKPSEFTTRSAIKAH